MAKTKSQATALKIKKEEDCKDQLKHTLIPNSSNTSATRGKITKRNASNSKRPLLSQVEAGEESDNKSLLKISKPRVCKQLRSTTQEQIEQLIHYIVKDGMSAKKASEKVNISSTTGRKYYKRYLNDPERRIPLLYKYNNKRAEKITQDQINKLIQYITIDNMTILSASKKANIPYDTSQKYYKQYLNNPSNGVPILKANVTKSRKPCTQDQINELFRYILDDKLSMNTAAIKCNMATNTVRKYYYTYLNNPSSGIPNPEVNAAVVTKRYTQDQINKVIMHIVQDKMSIAAASAQADMSYKSARNYYNKYLNGPNKEIPLAKAANTRIKCCTQDQINKLIRCIVEDKMTINDASKKANVSYDTGKKYYNIYLKNPSNGVPNPTEKVNNSKPCTQNQINELFRYILEDKIPINVAALKCNMATFTAKKYYQLYLDSPIKEIPHARIGGKRCSREQIDNLISYIVNDKMSITQASVKANMGYNAARKYYSQYLNTLA